MNRVKKVREKKSPSHIRLLDKTTDNWQNYRQAKKAVKKVVADHVDVTKNSKVMPVSEAKWFLLIDCNSKTQDYSEGIPTAEFVHLPQSRVLQVPGPGKHMIVEKAGPI
nr:unnamed protein product [Haemonchus contortus]